MSLQEHQDVGTEVRDTFLSPPTVSDTENDVLNYNTLTTSPIISVEPWLGINSESKLWLHCECTYTDGTPGLIELAEAVPADTSTGAQAFSCELPLDELSKLADNTLITIILMVSTTDTLEKQSLNAIRYELMFKHPITINNYSRWMTDIGADINYLRIHNLILPEAHNAGVDQKGAGWPTDQWGACQDDTFTYQLRNGIRVLDLRLYRDPKEMYTHKEYIFKHGGYHSRRYLNDCIHEVLEFAEQNPGEIVILDFHEAQLDGRAQDVITTLSIALGNRCIPSTARELTIGEIRNRHPGRNIIIAWWLSPPPWFCWPGVSQTWTGNNYNSPYDLLLHADQIMANPPIISRLWSMFAAGYNDLGPIRFGSDAAHLNFFFNAAHSNTYRQPPKGNVINVDFFAGTGVVDRCISATKNRARLAALSAPRNLIASDITTHSIKLSWGRPPETETPVNYRVFENGRRVHTTTSMEYEFTRLNYGRTYHLQVVANFSSGDGVTAGIFATTVGIPDTTKPSKPTELKFIFFDSSSLVLLSWVASTDNIAVTRYEVYGNGVRLGTIEDPQYTFYPISKNNNVTYTVRALDAAGNFADSDPLVFSLDQLPPSKPTNVRASAIRNNSVTLEWTPSSDNVAVIGYQVYPNNTPIDTVSSTFYLDRDLTRDTNYIYKVRALDAAGNFTDSDAITVRTSDQDMTPPSVPGNLRASTITKNSVTLEWDPSHDNVGVSEYEVRLNGTLLGTVPGTRYTVVGLSSNTNYTFSVVALDAAENHSEVAVIWVTTAPESNAPTELKLFRQLSSGNYSWKPPINSSGVTGYQVSLDGEILRELNDTFITLFNLQPGVIHLFEVRARRNGVLSDPASISG